MEYKMTNEIVELLWKTGINENKHEAYIDVINKSLESIYKIKGLFDLRLEGEVDFKLNIQTEDFISPEAGPMFGRPTIYFQVKLIIELIKLYECLYNIEIESSVDPQRSRRIILTVSLAFCHELTHILRGHDSTVVDANLPDNRAARAAEADADFLAGMQLHKWYTGQGIGTELMEKIGLTNDALGLPVFFKDAGVCSVLLAYFLHNNFNADNNEYHMPNVRANILFAGIMNGALSQTEHHHFVNLIMAGYKELINYLSKIECNNTQIDIINSFLAICPKEEDELLNQTSSDMDLQRKLADKSSLIWKALYSKALKHNRVAGGL